MNRNELKRLFDDEEFLAGLHEVDSLEKLQEFLAKKDLHMTIGEINKAIKTETELSENDLTDVSGGGFVKWKNIAWMCFSWSINKNL